MTFNLVDEGWIPCTLLDDRTVEHRSLIGVLTRPDEVREISCETPLETLALYRLLLAVLHTAIGPATVAAWGEAWHTGWDNALIERYVAAWHHRFDLFDTERPFYQTPHIAAEYAATVAVLRPELASRNNATLFDHSLDTVPPVLTPARAARSVLACQLGSPGGLVSYQHGLEPIDLKYAKSAPLSSAAAVLIRGTTLRATLLLNLTRYDPDEAVTDRPAWEVPLEMPGVERGPAGLVDHLTLQARRIMLLPEEEPDGSVVVRSAAVLRGRSYPPDVHLDAVEPMVPFRKIAKPSDGQPPWLPLTFRVGRAAWRDSSAIMVATGDENARSPQNIVWLNSLEDREVLDGSALRSLDVLGQTTDKAKILLQRQERLPLDGRYLDRPLAHALRQAVHRADDGANAVRSAVDATAAALLRGSDQSEPHREDVARVRSALGYADAYWSLIGDAFPFLAAALPDDVAPLADSTDMWAVRALQTWQTAVERAAKASFSIATRGCEASGRGLRALALGERTLHRTLARLRHDSASSSPPSAVSAPTEAPQPA